MKILKALGILTCAFAFQLIGQAEPRTVQLIQIRGTINPASANYLVSSIRKAEAANAEALVLELDTPGGLVSSVQEMAQAIDQSKVPVVVFVTPAGASATSAGALLSLASHVSAMAPGTHIGAAHPVDTQGKEIQGAMGEKVVNDTAALARSLAELRGRNRELAELVVSKSKSLTAQEALQQKLVDLLVNDRADLLQKLEGREVVLNRTTRHVIHSAGAAVQSVDMTWGQKILHTLANPNIATILMTVGILCLYVEITTPGITIAGVLGGISLLVAFMAFQLLPIRVGGLLLLGLAIILLIAEPFVVAHGALAIGGVISFLLGILWVMDPNSTTMEISKTVWIPAVLALGFGALVIGVAASRVRRLVKKALKELGGSASMGLSGYRGRVEKVDEAGHRGKAIFRGETWDFECEIPVKVGDWVEVIRMEGMRAVVQPAKEDR